MSDQIDKKRYEQNFRDIFSKLNKLVPSSSFTVTIIVLVGLWGSLFGLLYADMQSFKRESTDQRIEVIRELGEVKVLISKIKR